jgi:hypothetical protein
VKPAAALLGLVVGGLFVWLLWPFLKSRLDAPPKPPAPVDSRVNSLAPPRASRNDPVPFSPTEREAKREEYAKLRIPYFRFLREKMAGLVVRFWVDDDLDTLNLELSGDGDREMNMVIETAVTTEAATYGFRRVRLHVPNPAGNPEPYNCFAEASRGEDGRWTVFRK